MTYGLVKFGMCHTGLSLSIVSTVNKIRQLDFGWGSLGTGQKVKIKSSFGVLHVPSCKHKA